MKYPIRSIRAVCPKCPAPHGAGGLKSTSIETKDRHITVPPRTGRVG